MSFIPNLRSKQPGQDYVQRKIDTLIDYGEFLKTAEQTGAIVTGLTNPSQYKVAVVGTGPSGIVAAYELLRMGFQVDIFSRDQEGHRYGRTFSYPFPGNETYLAEMGAMRFPPSEAGLFFYMDKFGIKYEANFPDPGKVDTYLYLNGTRLTWSAGQPPPALFDTVQNGLNYLISVPTTLSNGKTVAAPATIAEYMLNGEDQAAFDAWQGWIDEFEDLSFGAGLSRVFQRNDTPPGGEKWSDEDMAIFGTIGVGSGGFGSLYSISFLEIIRLFVNELETDQKFVPTGIASVFDALANAGVNGRKVLDGHIAENIIGIERIDGPPKQIQLLSDAAGGERLYDRVVWAAPSWGSQTATNLIPFLKGVLPKSSPGAPDIPSAIEQLHVINSSKAFILTADKFWLKENLPQNIQSDTMVRGLYCLNYTPDQDPDGLGVVLISYTWQDDSAKQIGMPQDKKARTLALVEDVKQIDPVFASKLVPLNGDYEANTIYIDWMASEGYNGAFKLNQPKQSRLLQSAYNNFKLAMLPERDPLLYLAGDGVSFEGGWCEGAIETGLNAACAVGVSLGGTSIEPSPFENYSDLYDYRVLKGV